MIYIHQFIWIIFPYLMLSIFVVGHIYRYNTDQHGWSAQSSEILEKENLRLASMLFHWAILFAIFGHLSGLLLPKVALENIGITESIYHVGAVYAGGTAGIFSLLGIGLLLSRRLGNTRIRITSSTLDIVVLLLLLVIILLGNALTIGYNLLVGGFEYRDTIGPWFRGILMLKPDATLMANIPFLFQVHVLAAFTIIGLWPFTRLVHVWSFPLSYLHRSYVLYRRYNPKRIA